MKYTENFKLKKPEQTDSYNVDDFNENMEILDKILVPENISDQFIITPTTSTAPYANADAIASKQGKVISGEIHLSFKNGAADVSELTFEIPKTFSTLHVATTSVTLFDKDDMMLKPADIAIYFFSELFVKLFNSEIKYAIISFTYICE